MAFFRLLGPTNLWSAPSAVVTATTAAAGLPATASQNTDRTYVWRSENLIADQSVILDAGGTVAATVVAIANARPQNSGTFTLEEAGTGGAPGVWNNLGGFSVQSPDRRVSWFFLNGTVSARHWRIRSINPAGTADYAEIGYVYLGTYLSLTRTPKPPLDIRDVDPSVGRESVDGQKTHARRTEYQVGQFVIQKLSESEFALLMTFRRAHGIRTPFFCVLDTGVLWKTWLMRFSSDIEILDQEALLDYYDVSFSWEETR